MGLLGKLFKKEKGTQVLVLKEGDIFYTESDGKYHFFKLLKNDKLNKTYHVMGFEELSDLPDDPDLLKIAYYHAPIDSAGFTDPVLFTHSAVSTDDMMGYTEYLNQTGQNAEIIANADRHYMEANALADRKQYEASIEKYSLAIQLVPSFFEAIDNRAFSQMDLGRWLEAIADFKESLIINPEGFTAAFSIGECYMRLADYASARTYFELAQSIQPDNKHTATFLAKIEQALQG